MSLLRSLLLAIVLFAVYSMACQGGSQSPRRAVANQNAQNGQTSQPGQKGQKGQNGKTIPKEKPTPEDIKKKEFMELFKKISADVKDRVDNKKDALMKKDLTDPMGKYKLDDMKLKDFLAEVDKLPDAEKDKLIKSDKFMANA